MSLPAPRAWHSVAIVRTFRRSSAAFAASWRRKKTMDEFTAISRARAFIREINSVAIPAPIQAYLHKVNGKLKRDKTMNPDEAGFSFKNDGKYFITVNGNDPPERQNYTICHEIAHDVLALPSEHGA